MFLRSLLFVFATTIALAKQAPQPSAQLETAPVVRTHELPAGGGDGIIREMSKIPGYYCGGSGYFEFIKEADGYINHRLFRPNVGGKK